MKLELVSNVCGEILIFWPADVLNAQDVSNINILSGLQQRG